MILIFFSYLLLNFKIVKNRVKSFINQLFFLKIFNSILYFRNADSRNNGTDECKICYENIVDCVLYACGHMCLCYEVCISFQKLN